MNTHPLEAILTAIDTHRDTRPTVVFDLDGTLYDNRPRTLRIVHAYAASLPAEHARDAAVLHALTASELRYRLSDTLAPRGVSAEVIAGAQRAWQSRFFTDAACADDVPVAGAVAFVRACHARGATVVYFTGRDTPGMLVGTVRTLRDDGFPIGLPRVELVLKPTFEENDYAFKTRMLPVLGAGGTVVGAFDNEPYNCNLFVEHYPHSVSVLLDTQRSPEAPACHRDVRVVADFTR